MKKCTYSILETAEILGISKSLCYRLVSEGKIPTICFGSKRRITRQTLFQILNGNTSVICTGNKNEGGN